MSSNDDHEIRVSQDSDGTWLVSARSNGPLPTTMTDDEWADRRAEINRAVRRHVRDIDRMVRAGYSEDTAVVALLTGLTADEVCEVGGTSDSRRLA